MHVPIVLVSLGEVAYSLVCVVHDSKATVWRRREIVLDEETSESSIERGLGRNAR